MESPRLLLPLLPALCLAVWIGGCGGSDSTTGSTPQGSRESAGAASLKAKGSAPARERGGGGGTKPSGTESSGNEYEKVPGAAGADFTPPPHQDSGGGSAQFEAEGGDNSIQEYGSEPSSAEFAEAAAALHAYLDARAAHAWAAACEYLATGMREALIQQLASGGGKSSCAAILASLSAGVPDSALREAAAVDAGALRGEGDSGFLLLHGAHGVDWFVPMAREGGTWKVAALAPSALQ
jgi:hypothetical protein